MNLFLNRFIIKLSQSKKKGQINLTLYDWLILTSIACLIVITICGVYVLHLARKKLDQQTIEIKQCTEQLRALPETVVEQMQSSVDEIKERLKIGWRVFSFIRRQRKKRKLKKRMMSR